MNSLQKCLYLLSSSLIILSFNGCKEKTPPVLDSLIINNITDTSTIFSVNINNDGNEEIIERGLCYNTNPSPTISDNKKIVIGTIGSMNITISNLNSSTTYYAKAYATNSKGTSYSNEVTFTTHVSTKYLMAYYPFNGNTMDESGKANHAEIFGPVLTTDRDSNINSAYLFDGIDDYIEVYANQYINPKNEISLIAWINPTINGNDFDHIFTVVYNGNYVPYSAYNVCKLKDKMTFWLTTDESPKEDFVESVSTIIANNWYHVACTYDGNSMKLYINGILEASRPKTGEIQYKNASLKFGHAVKNQFLTGKLDEMRIYSKALTEKEIKQLYQKNK
jgi:hypothetical protein